MKFRGYNTDSSKIFLRSSDNGISYEGFERKKIGAWNKAENWTGIPSCETCGGFFGINKKFNIFGLIYGRSTIEMCEWRGKCVSINANKICVSEYRVLAINENIPDWLFEECGYKVLRKGGVVNNIRSGKWIIFGGKIKRISGGYQFFHNRSSAGNAEISSGNQYFYDRSSAGNAEISGGYQHFYNKASVGNAAIIGGHQRSYNGSSKVLCYNNQ